MLIMINKLSQKNINLFYENNLPLYVYGCAGCGKTTFCNKLLNDYVIEKIDSYDIKNHKNIYDYLVEKAEKKNITLMFSNNYKKRAFLIDDLDIFNKNDKKSYKGIIRFLKEKKYKQCKIVISFNEQFIKNKELLKIEHYKYYINSYGKNKNIINIQSNKKILNDIQYTIYEILDELILKKKNIKEIIECNLGDENQFLLNLLENIYHIINKEKLLKIYDNYIYYDMIELYSTGNHLWELKEYSKNIVLRGIYIYSKKKKIEMKNNSYISKSILTMSNKRCIIKDGYIYMYISYLLKKRKNKLKDIEDIHNIKIMYNHFYN